MTGTGGEDLSLFRGRLYFVERETKGTEGKSRRDKERGKQGEGSGKIKIKREFDPGSESTLAARLTHASRTRKVLRD